MALLSIIYERYYNCRSLVSAVTNAPYFVSSDAYNSVIHYPKEYKN